MRRLEVLGWWFHERAPDQWPRPQRLVRRWNANDRALVLRYLRAGRKLVRYAATSRCRFACGVQHVGRRDLTDGTFVWPDGLAHYVERHRIALPAHFVAHVRANDGRVAPFVLPKVRRGLYDTAPWLRWARAQRACVDLRGWQRPTPARAHEVSAEIERAHGRSPVGAEIVLCRRRPRTVVAQLANGALLVADLRRGGRCRRLAGWQQWPRR
jgi:hypothetical protein